MAFPFPLLSDPDEALCKQFDVIRMKNMYGKQVRGIERSTFVIDKDGKLAREWRKREGAGARAGSARVRQDAVTRLCRLHHKMFDERQPSDATRLCPGRERAYIKLEAAARRRAH